MECETVKIGEFSAQMSHQLRIVSCSTDIKSASVGFRKKYAFTSSSLSIFLPLDQNYCTFVHLPLSYWRSNLFPLIEQGPAKEFSEFIEKFWFMPCKGGNGRRIHEILPDGSFAFLFVVSDSGCRIFISVHLRNCVTFRCPIVLSISACSFGQGERFALQTLLPRIWSIPGFICPACLA